MRIQAISDRSLIRAGAESVRYVKLSLTAPAAPRQRERWPVNVALVLDRSGSMSGAKIELAKDAVAQALRLLRREDRFALVVYDNEVDLLGAAGAATADAKRRALGRLAQTGARGTTNLSGGWLKGADQVGSGQNGEMVGRVLLLTDGLANHGITDRGELVTLAQRLRADGVATSTFGVGEDFDERLLRGMAEASGGNFYFIEAPEQIPDLLASELGETLEVVARDVVLEIALDPGMSATALNRFSQFSGHGAEAPEAPANPAPAEVSPNPGSTAGGPSRSPVFINLGDLVSRQEVEAVIQLSFPPGTEGRRMSATFSVTAAGEQGSRREDPTAGSQRALLSWTCASHPANDAQPRNREVDLSVATLYAARARDEALDRNRDGDHLGARRVLRATANRIREYAGDDPRLMGLDEELEREAEDYGERQLSAKELKLGLFANYLVARGRGPLGKAKRGKP